MISEHMQIDSLFSKTYWIIGICEVLTIFVYLNLII